MFLAILLSTLISVYMLSMMMASPLVLCGCLLIVSTLNALLYLHAGLSWSFYAICLVYLGGMMIVLLYVSTMALSIRPLMKLSFLVVSLTSLYLVLLSTALQDSEMWFSFVTKSMGEGMKSFYSPSSSHLVQFLIVYLLLTLGVTVTLSESFKGALSKKW